MKLSLSLLSAALFAAAGGSAYALEQLPAYPVKGHVIEQLHRFDHPEGTHTVACAAVASPASAPKNIADSRIGV